MEEKPPPRKQLRLLVKGREKVSNLMEKHRRGKNRRKVELNDRDPDSDSENDIPILSKIADPASKATSTSDSREANGIQSTHSTLPFSAEDGGSTQHQSIAATVSPTNKETYRTPRLKDDSIPSRPNVIHQGTEFTFRSVPPAADGTIGAPSFDPQIDEKSQAKSQPDAGIRSTDPKSYPRLEHFTRDLSAYQKLRVDARPPEAGGKVQYIETADKSKAKSAKASQTPTDPIVTKPVQPRRLFDSFKIGKNPLSHAPRIDRASPITNVSAFIQPHNPIPENSPQVYRSFCHKPSNISRSVLERCLPDTMEGKLFVEDIEAGSLGGRKNENGDVPALVHDAHTERVPIGARMRDSVTNERLMIFPGKPVMQAVPEAVQTMAGAGESAVVPEDLHTEPGRLVKAYLASAPSGSLKRKRPTGTTLPPPSYIHKRRWPRKFNIFSHGFLLHPELCFLLAAQLPVQTLINLYSISKDYHTILNQRFTTVILNQISLKAPAAVRCYPWRCYTHLCQPDPSYRAGTSPLTTLQTTATSGTTINIKPPPPPAHEAITLPGLARCTLRPPTNTQYPISQPPPSKRRVPTFRWLHMALHREKTIHELYHLFALRGVPLPGHPTNLSQNSFALTLHKLMFAFDIPDNIRRLSYFRSTHIITPCDLTNILVFTVKLDMAFNSPESGEKRDALRKLVMSSVNGLDTLRRVLKGELWADEMGILRAWTRYAFQLDRENPQEPEPVLVAPGWVSLRLSEEDNAASDNIFGIPRDEVGLLRKEFWGEFDYNYDTRMRTWCPLGRKTSGLLRPDQIVLREAVRRGYKMGKQILQAVLVGYLDEETLEPVEGRELNGGRSEVLEGLGEYGVDDLVGAVEALDVEDGGDELLDVGGFGMSGGSALSVRRIGARRGQVGKVREERERLQGYMAGWREDVERENARRAYQGFTFVDG